MEIIEIEKTGTVTRVWVGVSALDDESVADADTLAEQTIGERSSEVIAWSEGNVVEVLFT